MPDQDNQQEHDPHYMQIIDEPPFSQQVRAIDAKKWNSKQAAVELATQTQNREFSLMQITRTYSEMLIDINLDLAQITGDFLGYTFEDENTSLTDIVEALEPSLADFSDEIEANLRENLLDVIGVTSFRLPLNSLGIKGFEESEDQVSLYEVLYMEVLDRDTAIGVIETFENHVRRLRSILREAVATPLTPVMNTLGFLVGEELGEAEFAEARTRIKTAQENLAVLEQGVGFVNAYNQLSVDRSVEDTNFSVEQLISKLDLPEEGQPRITVKDPEQLRGNGREDLIEIALLALVTDAMQSAGEGAITVNLESVVWNEFCALTLLDNGAPGGNINQAQVMSYLLGYSQPLNSNDAQYIRQSYPLVAHIMEEIGGSFEVMDNPIGSGVLLKLPLAA